MGYTTSTIRRLTRMQRFYLRRRLLDRVELAWAFGLGEDSERYRRACAVLGRYEAIRTSQK